MKFSEAATTAAAAAAMEGCCVRNAFIPPLSSSIRRIYFLPSPRLASGGSGTRVCVFSRCGARHDDAGGAFPVFKVLPYVPFLSPAMCPPGKFQKSYNHSRLHGDGERANIRFSRLPTFPSSAFIWFSTRVAPFVSLSIFLRCLSLLELFSCLCSLFLSPLSVLSFLDVSFETKNC